MVVFEPVVHNLTILQVNTLSVRITIGTSKFPFSYSIVVEPFRRPMHSGSFGTPAASFTQEQA